MTGDICFVFFLAKLHAPFKRTDAVSRSPVSPGSAEAQVRSRDKIMCLLIDYFRSNISAKNQKNQTISLRVSKI